MKFKLIVKHEAEKELRNALMWHEEQSSGLDIAFYKEISSVFEDIVNHPDSFQKRYKEVRIRFTKKFKYGVHYTIESDKIFVHAIFHTSRKPKK